MGGAGGLHFSGEDGREKTQRSASRSVEKKRASSGNQRFYVDRIRSNPMVSAGGAGLPEPREFPRVSRESGFSWVESTSRLK